MGNREIKSPEALKVGTPKPASGLEASEANDNNTIYDQSCRKKLGIYFIESDDRRRAIGGGYTVGSTPVNIRRNPMSDSDLSKTGGWVAAFFIFGKFQCIIVMLC